MFGPSEHHVDGSSIECLLIATEEDESVV